MIKDFSTAEARWARFGPYYATFPVQFAFDVIQKYSKEGDCIIDPFAGRCSSIYAAAVLGREALGVEINPIGYLYGKTKLNPQNKEKVIHRIAEIYEMRNEYKDIINSMPEFYRMCYCDEVLQFLLAARNMLNWKNNSVDSTVVSFLLNHLHGSIGEALSNQMRNVKSMGMNYSIAWWKKNNMEKAPVINPYEFLVKKIEWRYKKGTPKTTKSRVILGDSTKKLTSDINNKKYSLLFTSPPYYSLVDYHAEQWLRLWLLGYSENPQVVKGNNTGRFTDKKAYKQLLTSVFGLCANMMEKKNTVYVRTDKRTFTFNTTLSVLQDCFPSHSIAIVEKPLMKNTNTQTKLFGDKSLKPGEVDIILTA